MARRRRPERREILPDPRFGDVVLSKFMNSVMLDGKKSIAEGIVYGALESVEARAKKEPIGVLHEALAHLRPNLEVRSRRVGDATSKVPGEDRKSCVAGKSVSVSVDLGGRRIIKKKKKHKKNKQ